MPPRFNKQIDLCYPAFRADTVIDALRIEVMAMVRIGLAVIVDSSAEENYRIARETIFPFLEHFEMPYREIDLAGAEAKNFDLSGILIAQEGLGEKISKKTRKSLHQALRTGIGLVNLDPDLNYWKEFHQPLGIEKLEGSDRTSLLKIEEEHYITQLQERGRERELRQPLEMLKAKAARPALLLSGENSPLLLVSGSPRLVQFLISPKLWQAEYFGFCAGLDDLLWRSLVWTAKKPFPMKPLPPFVTARIDDASGSAGIFGKKKNSANKSFAYIDLLNKHGFVPNIGLFIDDISQGDGRIIKEKHDQGLADFSPPCVP